MDLLRESNNSAWSKGVIRLRRRGRGRGDHGGDGWSTVDLAGGTTIEPRD